MCPFLLPLYFQAIYTSKAKSTIFPFRFVIIRVCTCWWWFTAVQHWIQLRLQLWLCRMCLQLLLLVMRMQKCL